MTAIPASDVECAEGEASGRLAARGGRRSRIAVYAGDWIALSATFVYRQVVGVADWFEPIVLAERTLNRELFPFEPVHACARGRVEDLAVRALARLRGRVAGAGPLQLRRWRRALDGADVRLVHAYFGTNGIAMLPLARTLRVPLLVTFLGYDQASMLRFPRYVRSLERLFRVAHVIALSSAMRDRLVRLGAEPSRLHVVHLGIPAEQFAFVERLAPREKVDRGQTLELLQVSRFVAKKGHAVTLEAFRRLVDVHPRCRLTLAGDGPLLEPMTQRARELGLEGRVVFPGKVTQDQVVELLRRADAFVHHSVTGPDGDEEGTPTALMEAMSTGLPVVSTFHAGIAEVVEDGVTGHLVAERDVDAYADRMRRLLACDGSMGRRAAAVIRDRFDAGRTAEELAEIYASLVAGRAR